MNKLTRKQVSMIFQAKCRMLKIKANFKTKFNNVTTCRLCGLKEETQEHVLTECNQVHDLMSKHIKIENLFQDDEMSTLKSHALYVESVMQHIEDFDS